MLGNVAKEAAERFGDTTAYVAPDGSTLSYRELDQFADEVAVGLVQRGVAEGDVVALVLPQCPEYFIAYIAAARVGAITAGVNVRLSAPERAAVLATADAALVIDSVSAVSDLRARGEAPAPLADDVDRPVAIVFTSGTTGTPKGAVFANRQLSFITQTDTAGNWGGGGTTFAATSFAHLGPMTKLPGALIRGATTYVLERWRAADALRLVAEHRMSSIGGIPTQVALMLQDPDFDAYDLSSVKAIVLGGGPATPALIREARERFGAALAIRYSCTEAGIGIGTAFDGPLEDAEVSVGRPHAGVDLEIRDVDRDSGVGEVCLRSPAVMAGYWRAPELTAAAITHDGFVRTGDLGWIDDAGRLRLVGRSKEMYVRGGYNVYPMEVEGVLATHPAVADVAIAPRSDDVMGEVGVAVIVPREGAEAPTVDELRTFAEDRLARYKLPEDVVVVAALPLTAMEKLDRRALARDGERLMQLDFTADQEELRSSVRSVLEKECTGAFVREHAEHVVRNEPSEASGKLWQTFVSLDWPALTIAEEHGGIGLGYPELAVVAEELGRVLAPGPLLTTIAGFAPLLREAEGGGEWLAKVAAGEISGAAAFTADAVLCGGDVDVVAVVLDGEIAVVPPKVTRTIESLDPTRSLVDLDVEIGDGPRLPISLEGVRRAREEMTVAIAFELVGTCQTMFETNLQYAKERQQFGVPIGSFQAVKHKLANMFVAIQRARALCMFAAATINEDDERRVTASSAAKAAAGDCQRLVAQDGIQLLGGIGYTWEHDQHFYVKRAKVSDALFGNASFHRQQIADALGL